MMVAIKSPQNLLIKSEKAELERELRYLSQHKHQNFINLIGYAEHGGNMSLVYEYMKNTSVPKKFKEIDWDKTKRIALGSVAAMEYLHTREPPLIFRDFKLANILLDEEFNPKLSDFGGVTEEGEKLCCGTPGCTDDQLIYDGVGLRALDMYGMGTVLIHLVKQYNPHGNEESNAKKIRKEVEAGQYIVSEKLQDSGCSGSSARQIINLALSCIDDDVGKRPSIQEVIRQLRLLQ